MQTARELLDNLGKPPCDICLDWCWQLVELAKHGHLPKNLSWADLEVTASGELQSIVAHQSVSQIDSQSATRLSQSTLDCIGQLLEWSGMKVDRDAYENIETIQRQLSQWTRQYLVRDSDVPEVSDSKSCTKTTTKSPKNEPVSFTVASSAHSNAIEATDVKPEINFQLCEQINEVENLTTASVQATSEQSMPEQSASDLVSSEKIASEKSSRSSVARSGQKAVTAGRKPLYLAVSAVLLLVLGGAAWWMRSKRPDASKIIANADLVDEADSNSKSAPKKSIKTSSSSSSKKQKKSSNSELDELLGGTSWASSNSLESGQLANIDPSKDNGETSLEPLVATGDSNTTETTVSNAIPSAADSNPPESLKSGNSADSTKAMSTSKLDVAGQTSQESVAKLLANVSNGEAKVTSIDTDSDQTANNAIPAKLLNVESVVQVQEVPSKLRVRQPAWQLRISSTSAMEVEPPTAQTLAEKTMVHWILTSKELKPRKNQEPTKVAVIAELANKRGDIRWRIVAGTPDLPGLQFPLSETHLDQLLNLLQDYQQRLTISVDQIKAAMELPDFPKEQRSTWTTQRKSFEAEAKLTTRARQVVADAAMLSSWMDRTIEVHGRLVETTGNKSDTLVEFGQVKLPVPTNPASEEPTQSDKGAEVSK